MTTKEIFKVRGKLSNYFKDNGDGTYTAYHVEGGETLDIHKVIDKEYNNLTLKTLSNKHPLFICNNPYEWFPSHSTDFSKYKILEIKFKKPPFYVEGIFKNYQDLFYFIFEERSDQKEKYRLSERGIKLHNSGIDLFIYDSSDGVELSEAFLLFPKNYVISIKNLNGEHS